MARRPVECEDAAPVVADEHDVAEVERGEPRVEVARVIRETVGDVGLA